VFRAHQAIDANPTLQGLLGALAGQATAEAEQLHPALLSVPLNVLGIFFGLSAMLTMALFWLTSVDALKPFVVSILPPEHRANGDAVLAFMADKPGGHPRGTLVGVVLIGATTGVALYLLGVPYALLLGIFQVVPFVGQPISSGVAELVALAAVGPAKAAEVLVVFAAIQLIEGNPLIPVMLSRTVRTSPLTVVVGVIAGASLPSLPGAVLGVPLAAETQRWWRASWPSWCDVGRPLPGRRAARR
jgi:predicted PurR-regulated permease PerM